RRARDGTDVGVDGIGLVSAMVFAAAQVRRHGLPHDRGDRGPIARGAVAEIPVDVRGEAQIRGDEVRHGSITLSRYRTAVNWTVHTRLVSSGGTFAPGRREVVMRILVIGATGTLGREIAALLRE